MIHYQDSLTGITPELRQGFFEGWPHPPTPEAHLRILEGSGHRILALDDTGGSVVGFITAISDGISSAYIPFLEVIPTYRHSGIGGELLRRMLSRLDRLYMIDLTCDPEMKSFYERSGMVANSAMSIRNYHRQSCSE
jgi:ribosomal protein S18 acetylase RimI-like enzyme